VTQQILDVEDLGTAEQLRPAFARHETFHPRFGWLKKGFDLATQYPDVFIRADATVLLGVGKNMVRAIRYWCLAFKILAETPNADRPRHKDARPTSRGTSLLGETGWDPYLEHPGSLWLLQWWLLRPPCLAPASYAAFSDFRHVEFADSDLLDELIDFRDRRDDWNDIVDGSLKKDALCILRMYAGGTTARGTSEESLDSPFVELQLLNPISGARHQYRFNVGPKESLPDEVVAHACLDHIALRHPSAQTVAVRRLAYEPGGPGHAFKLTENDLIAVFERLQRSLPAVALSSAAGIAQLSWRHEPRRLAATALSSLYEREARVAAP